MDIKLKLNQIKGIVAEIESSLADGVRFDKDKFMSFYPASDDAALCYDSVSRALEAQGILDSLTLIGALATVRIEVGRAFKPIREISSGSQYEWRADLGNTIVGDGPKYKGRGYIQITGKLNYRNYGNALGIDLIGKPDLALDPDVSAKILALYFKDKNISSCCKDQNWAQARRLVNGGLTHLAEFQSVVNQYLSTLQ